MSKPYTSKEYWFAYSQTPCLHCDGRIRYRPIPLGISETASIDSITTCNGFCSWPCAGTYADANFPDDTCERLTTRIMSEFKANCDPYDDPDGWRFLQRYNRFSQIPRAPPRHSFVPYGPLTHEKFREGWASGGENQASTFGDLVMAKKTEQRLAAGTGTELRSSTASGPVVDTTSEADRFVFRPPITSYSTKRQYRPGVRMGQTYWPLIEPWQQTDDGTYQ